MLLRWRCASDGEEETLACFVLWLLLSFRISFILCVHFSGSVLQWLFSVLLTSIKCIAEDAISVLRWVLASFD